MSGVIKSLFGSGDQPSIRPAPSVEPAPSVDTAAVQAASAAAKRRVSGYSTQVSGQLSTPSIGTTTLLGR